MRILQLAWERAPTRVAPSGAHLGMFQNLCALTDLGHEVHLAIIGPRDEADAEVRGRVASVSYIAAVEPSPVFRGLKRVLNPETFLLRFPSAEGFEQGISRLADRLNPDVIWADSAFALALAPRLRFPVVFGHYDFLYKLKKVRRETQRLGLRALREPRRLRSAIRRPDAMRLKQLESLELKLASEAANIMCVSASESDFLRTLGIESTYIPIVGPTIPAPTGRMPDRGPRFFLFGNHNTAHAAALSEIRRKVWPALKAQGVRGEWHQIGKPPRNPDEDWRWMEANFDRVHGFIEDLSEVFGVGDISVVPYHHDTGFRTKFTVAAGFGVISAGYIASFLCAPEFTRAVDCIAEEGVDGLVRAFGRAHHDRAWREALGIGARAVYEKTFTFEAQLPRYAQILARAQQRRPAVAATG